MADFGFELKSIALLQASFERPLELHFPADEVATHTNLKVVTRNFAEPVSRVERVEIELTVSVVVPTINADEPMAVSARMLGVFQVNGEAPPDALDSFGNINGPAILYPFVREVIASLTLRADASPVMLPTMNFAAAYQTSRDQNNAARQVKPAPAPLHLEKPKKPARKSVKKAS